MNPNKYDKQTAAVIIEYDEITSQSSEKSLPRQVPRPRHCKSNGNRCHGGQWDAENAEPKQLFSRNSFGIDRTCSKWMKSLTTSTIDKLLHWVNKAQREREYGAGVKRGYEECDRPRKLQRTERPIFFVFLVFLRPFAVCAEWFYPRVFKRKKYGLSGDRLIRLGRFQLDQYWSTGLCRRSCWADMLWSFALVLKMCPWGERRKTKWTNLTTCFDRRMSV